MGALNMSSRWGFARLVTTVLAGLALLQAAPAAAQSSGVEFTVSGTSTIRGWTCSASGSAEVTPGAAEPVPGFDTGVQTATLTVPVNGFDCPEEITFRLESYEVSGRQAQATGSLTILDATEPVTFPISLSPSGAGVEIEGELRLDMTTYGVEPPVVMLGLLRVRPQIRIEFTGLLAS